MTSGLRSICRHKCQSHYVLNLWELQRCWELIKSVDIKNGLLPTNLFKPSPELLDMIWKSKQCSLSQNRGVKILFVCFFFYIFTGGLNPDQNRFGCRSAQERCRMFPHVHRLFLIFPEIIYSWVFNEFPSFVAEDSRRFISQHTGNLYISKVQPSDVGSYICLVKNTVTNARVLSPPTPLTLKTDGEASHKQ